MEVVASPSQGRTAAAQCGLFTYKSVPVIFEPPCIKFLFFAFNCTHVSDILLNLSLAWRSTVTCCGILGCDTGLERPGKTSPAAYFGQDWSQTISSYNSLSVTATQTCLLRFIGNLSSDFRR